MRRLLVAALATLTLSEDLSRDPLCDDAYPVYNVVTVDDYAPAPEKDTMKAGDVPEPEAPNAHYLGWQIDSSKESSMGHWCRLQRPPFGVHARAGARASEDTHRGKPPIESNACHVHGDDGRQGKGYYWPLFKYESECEYYASNAACHPHTFEGSDVVYYMPGNDMHHGDYALPEDGSAPPACS